MSGILPGIKRQPPGQLEGPSKRRASMPLPQAQQPPTWSRGHSGPAATGFGEGKVKMTMDEAIANLMKMSSDLNTLIQTEVSQIKKEDEFVGIIGGPLEAPVSDAERAVAQKVLGEGNVNDQVVGQARTVVASMIAGLIAYANHIGVLGPAVKAAAQVGDVGVKAAADAASASVTMLNGLLSMPSLLMTGLRAAVPIGGFLCNPNVLALLPILFLGYSLSGKDAKEKLIGVLKGGKEAIVKKVEIVYGLGEEAANNLVSNAESVIGGAGGKTITMFQAVSELYLKMFASACAVVGNVTAAGEAISGVPTTILGAFKSLRKSVSDRMGQARVGVGSFADRIKEATMKAAKDVTCELRGEEGASMGGRKTRKRVGRRHRHRGKRGASTRKGKGKGKGTGKGKGRGRGGSTRKGKGKSKGKGRGSSTRRRHSRKH